MSTEKLRAKFEAWYSIDEGVYFDGVDEYNTTVEHKSYSEAKLTQYAWEAYQQATKESEARTLKIIESVKFQDLYHLYSGYSIDVLKLTAALKEDNDSGCSNPDCVGGSIHNGFGGYDSCKICFEKNEREALKEADR